LLTPNGVGDDSVVARLLWALVVAWVGGMVPGAYARVHVVERGDSLSEIAETYGVAIEDLREWNRLADDTIRIGQELEVGEPAAGPGVHRVREGETLMRIARRHGITVEAILARNPGLDRDRLRVGDEIALSARPSSESVGAPGAGAIRGTTQLRAHPAFVLRNPERAYATQRTIDRLLDGFDALRRAEPDAPRVRVHDLSLREGGPIDDHRTHQSGRDVDITYFQERGCGGEGCPLRALAPDELDVRRQWALLHHWLSRGEIEVIYVDRALQEPLYREARRQGATAEQLAAWFQYPRASSANVGLVRHYPNHADHVHVRFACHATEPRCERAEGTP
jgi:LysM repeat protein